MPGISCVEITTRTTIDTGEFKPGLCAHVPWIAISKNTHEHMDLSLCPTNFEDMGMLNQAFRPANSVIHGYQHSHTALSP